MLQVHRSQHIIFNTYYYKEWNDVWKQFATQFFSLKAEGPS